MCGVYLGWVSWKTEGDQRRWESVQGYLIDIIRNTFRLSATMKPGTYLASQSSSRVQTRSETSLFACGTHQDSHILGVRTGL